jgi:hypothetical protein
LHFSKIALPENWNRPGIMSSVINEVTKQSVYIEFSKKEGGQAGGTAHACLYTKHQGNRILSGAAKIRHLRLLFGLYYFLRFNCYFI